MNAEQFFMKVELMRKTQKEYFKTRDKDILTKSKLIEKEIDDEIERVNNIIKRKSLNND